MKLARMVFAIVSAVFLLAGCTAAELAVDLAKKTQKKAEAIDSAEKLAAGKIVAQPRYKVGDPYNVGGVWYYPARDLAYDETGIGSWYGDEFAGKLTANGEIFDPEKITAAHKTLPMPSVVRVTNLDNGKSLVVRINDRGPFVPGRIIDLSREAARLIGYKAQGLAKVRVKVLTEQSLRLEGLAKNGKFPEVDGIPEEDKPEFNAVGSSDVAFSATSTSGRTAYVASDGQSAIDLLSTSRVGEVIAVPPIETSIWVQIGAFHSEENATNVLKRIRSVGVGQISKINRDGQILHRVRLGPISDVNEADTMLSGAFGLGFRGARIIVD
ncbi:MAG: septal ring lytic transglycosylase RlpA family protein [Bacteroidetes bacterium]|nr:septal ring lytic transglycosylase RlpA family protein [Bacteroidota bacterium]